jgi:hypothetical protein
MDAKEVAEILGESERWVYGQAKAKENSVNSTRQILEVFTLGSAKMARAATNP